MRYLMLVKSTSRSSEPAPVPLREALNRFNAEAGAALIAHGGLLPVEAAITVSLDEDEIIQFDGPFSEAKEVVGGYAIYDLNNDDEAVEWTHRFLDLHKQHWPGCRAAVEIRQIMN